MQLIFDGSISLIYRGVLAFFFVMNVVLALLIIFLDRERRDATSTWAWLFLLFVMPILGFIIYIYLGRAVRKKRERGFEDKKIEDGLKTTQSQLRNDTKQIRELDK